MKRLGVFLLPLDGMLVYRRSLPSNLLTFPNNSPVPIYTPGWREALWESSVLPKNTTQCPPAKARTRTARSGDERTNHEATAPPKWCLSQTLIFWWNKLDKIRIIICSPVLLLLLLLIFLLLLLLLFVIIIHWCHNTDKLDFDRL